MYGQWSWQIHYRGVGMLCSLCFPVCVQMNQLNVLTAWYLIFLRRGMSNMAAVENLGVSVLSGYTLYLCYTDALSEAVSFLRDLTSLMEMIL